MRHAFSRLGLVTVCALGFQAQAQQSVPLQHEYYIGEGQVELHKGVFAYANEDIGIGRNDQDAALVLSRYFGVHQHAGSEAPFGANTGHNLEISLYKNQFLKEGYFPPNWSYEIALVRGRTQLNTDPYRSFYTNFPNLGTPGMPPVGSAAAASSTLITSNGATGPFVYTAEDGTQIEFPAFDSTTCANIGFTSKTCTRASALIKPNGERLNFTYETVSNRRLLRTVISTRGYGIGIDYAPPSPGAQPTVSKVCVVNLAVQYMAPAGPCPVGARAATYSYLPTTSAYTALQSYTDTSSASTTYSYGSDLWTMTGIRDPGSAVNNLTINYDANYKVASQIYADGSTWTYVYQGLGSWYDYPQNDWTQVTNPLGQMTRHEFGGAPAPKPDAVKDPLNRTLTFQFVLNKPHLVFREIAPEGNYTEYAYDGRENRSEVKLVAKAGSGFANRVITSTFPATCTNRVTCNKPDYAVDARGNRTDYTYDPVHGGVLTETLPAPTPGAVRSQRRFGYSQQYAWYKNSAGTLVQAPSAVWLLSSISECRTHASCAGADDETLTTFSYGVSGAANNLLRTSRTIKAGDNSISATTSWTYDEWGNVLTEDGPLAGTADTTRARYDAMNRVIGVIGPDPDGAGALLHRAVRTTYDAVGRVMKVERGTVASQSDAHWSAFASLQSTEYQRDNVGRVTATLVKGGGTTYSVVHTNYDGAWRPLCSAQRMDATQWASQSNACVPQTSGAEGPDRIAKNTYDAAGQLTTVQRAVGTSNQIDEVSYAYSPNGQRASLTDAENNKTSFDYDGFDRLYRTRYPVPTRRAQLSSSSDYEQVVHDANDNVEQRRLRSGDVIVYTYDALNRQTLKNLPGSEADVISTYDLQGRLRTTTQSGSAITRGYDSLGNLRSEQTALGTLTYLPDAIGRRKQTMWSDGFYVTYDYFTTGEPKEVRESGATILISYGYDNLGRRLSATRGNGTITSFGYDAVSRLSSLAHGLAGSASDVSSSFTYNPASQIRTRIRDNDAYTWVSQPAANVTYTANGLNQFTQSNPGSGAVSFGYDARGNLTSHGVNTYSYMAENRLASGPSGATLSYDPNGRLSQYSVGGNVTRLQYDGVNLVTEWNGSGQVTRRYVHGVGTDEPIVWYEGRGTADRRWLHQDERGSIVAVSNDAGASIAINSYDEYGIPAGTNLGRFQYTGQTWLPDLGMYYYKARMYSPSLGRFMQTDPIGYQDDFNLYAYSRNDPTNRIDPLGDASLLVARALAPPVGYLGLGHAFIVTNARYLGDPNARIHSFGPMADGSMGNMSDKSRVAESALNTHADDRRAWLRLAYRNVTANAVQIDAPDELVDALAEAVLENKPYSILPSHSESVLVNGVGMVETPETNSNSAAFAVADRARQVATGNPNARVDRRPFTLTLPGARASGKVEFESKRFYCTGSRIARESFELCW